MTGYLYTTFAHNLLPFQFSENFQNLVLEDREVGKDKLPTFFSEPIVSDLDITTVTIRKFNFDLLKNSLTNDDLINSIISETNLSTPSDYVKSIDKGAKRIYVSFGSELLTEPLDCGWFQIYFTNGVLNFMTDIFHCDGITDYNLIIYPTADSTLIRADSTLYTADSIKI